SRRTGLDVLFSRLPGVSACQIRQAEGARHHRREGLAGAAECHADFDARPSGRGDFHVVRRVRAFQYADGHPREEPRLPGERLSRRPDPPAARRGCPRSDLVGSHGAHGDRRIRYRQMDRGRKEGRYPDRMIKAALLLLGTCFASPALSQPVQPLVSLAQKEKPALLETLKELTAIESGSRELEELDRVARLLAAKLRALGGKVELIEPTESDMHRLSDTPEKVGKMVRATVTGTGTCKILLLAHMDTVYPRGMLAQQPFRIEGDRAYGLGIADDRHGIAVILHSLAMLRAMKFRDYGTITVFINADEEIGSPGSRNHHIRLGAEHDA